MPKTNKREENTHCCNDAVIEQILEQIKDILITRAEKVDEVVESASGLARTGKFNIKWDKTSGVPDVTVSFSISEEAVRDRRHAAFSDPVQCRLPIDEESKGRAPEVSHKEKLESAKALPEVLPKPKKGKSKKRPWTPKL